MKTFSISTGIQFLLQKDKWTIFSPSCTGRGTWIVPHFTTIRGGGNSVIPFSEYIVNLGQTNCVIDSSKIR